MRYTLMVSRNGGTSYQQEAVSESLEELMQKGVALDNEGLRWVVEDEEGRIAAMSAAHRGIVEFFERAKNDLTWRMNQ